MTRNHAFSRAALAALILSVLTLGLPMLPGCKTVEADPNLPGNALMAAEGSGRLAYSAPADGTVYIYDATRDRMIYSGRVEEGERVVVSPDKRHVAIDERPVSEGDITRRNQHRIYFVDRRPEE